LLELSTATPQNLLRNAAITLALMLTVLHDAGSGLTGLGNVGRRSVQVDTLAADNLTTAFSQIRTGFSFVPLTGSIGTTPPGEFAHWLNSYFSSGYVDCPGHHFRWVGYRYVVVQYGFGVRSRRRVASLV